MGNSTPSPKGRVVVTARIQPDLDERLRKMADTQQRSQSNIIELLLKDGLNRLETGELVLGR